MKLDYLRTPHKRLHSKWIKDLNVSFKPTKTIGENIGSKISDTAHSNILSDMSSQAREKKEKIKWDYIKLKSVCLAKETINKIKTTHGMGEHIYQYI